jgi:hypothetical protein
MTTTPFFTSEQILTPVALPYVSNRTKYEKFAILLNTTIRDMTVKTRNERSTLAWSKPFYFIIQEKGGQT